MTTLLTEGNFVTSISPPGVFLDLTIDMDRLADAIVVALRRKNLMVSPMWVRNEVERQLMGAKSSSSPGNTVGAFLRSARLL